MTKEEIEALVAEGVKKSLAGAFEDSFNTLREYLNDAVSPLVAKIEALEEVATTPTPTPSEPPPGTEPIIDPDNTETMPKDPAQEALIERLRVLEEKEATAAAREKEQRFTNSLRGLLAAHDPQHPSVVEELLQTRLKGLVEKDGEYYSTKGEKLGELVNSFFTTPEGLHFKRPQTRTGSGETPKNEPPAKSNEISLSSMLADMSL